MAKAIWANGAKATLASGITNSQTTITLTSGEGALFPSPTGTQFFALTLQSATNASLVEITYCTARSGDTLTVTRAQEGTSGLAFNAGDIAANLVTAGTLALLAPLDSPALTGDPTAPTATAGDSTTKLATTAFVNPGSSLGPSGWKRYPDPTSPTGYTIEQWGSYSGTTGSLVNGVAEINPIVVTFPIAFPTACSQVFPSAFDVSGACLQETAWGAPTATTTQCALGLSCKQASTVMTGNYLAKGY